MATTVWCVFKFPKRSVAWTENGHLMRFQSEDAVLRFLQSSMDPAQEWPLLNALQEIGDSSKNILFAKSAPVYWDFAVFILAMVFFTNLE